MTASGSIGKFLLKNKGTVFNGVLGVTSAMSTYQDEREQGSSALSATASAGIDLALPMMMSAKKYIGLQILPELPGLALDTYTAAQKYRRQLARERNGQAFVNAKFEDSEQAYTMRQAGMAIAQRSKYNTQQAMLGNEAKYMMK